MLLVGLRLSYLNLKEREGVNPGKNKDFDRLLCRILKTT
ncbi:MAG: hypothetical protein JETT_3889 [Candidatus Jettenia ecosi]|uniref:Uncharacterized protein n=1 Tax=Candidatus Jettenia ecosi TaxID=2494326 RepID=A0A533QH12_9BACT|nr:MAG: hypothetical protein JETT_3889 [Candidatus Jettenia ecosi]